MQENTKAPEQGAGTTSEARTMSGAGQRHGQNGRRPQHNDRYQQERLKVLHSIADSLSGIDSSLATIACAISSDEYLNVMDELAGIDESLRAIAGLKDDDADEAQDTAIDDVDAAGL